MVEYDHPCLPSTLGDYIRKRRLDLNLTQKQLAEKILFTSNDNVRNWEKNRLSVALSLRPKPHGCRMERDQRKPAKRHYTNNRLFLEILWTQIRLFNIRIFGKFISVNKASVTSSKSMI